MADPTMQCRGNGGSGEGDGMRTVECLRGRLLAERVASKAAKEEADQLANRLDELEKKLSDETKIRNKAEKRLRRAIKKLESLKILDVELAESSIGSLSSNGCPGHQPPEMEERDNPGSLSTVDSVRPDPRGVGEAKGWDGGDGDSAGGSSAGSCTQVNSSSQDGSWFSVVSEQSGSGPCKGEDGMDPDDIENCGSGEGAGDADHDSEREQPVASNGSSISEEGYRDEDDDRLALVLVDAPHHSAKAGVPRTEQDTRATELQAAEEESSKLAIVLADPQPRPDAEAGAPDTRRSGNDVQSVLLALRQVKEQLRYTIERRSEGLVAHRELYGH